MSNVKKRLEELRKAIHEENISYGEIAELQSLAEYIDKGDVELLQWAGVPEFTRKISVVWETDDEVVDLPKVVEIDASIDDENVSEWLSDEYGWLVSGWYPLDEEVN